MLRMIASSAARRLVWTGTANTIKSLAAFTSRTLQVSAVPCQLATTKTATPSLLRVVGQLASQTKLLAVSTPLTCIQIRPLTKFSLQKGKRKSVKAVVKRFYRLDWGIWIHTKCGRHKHMWKKTSARKRRLSQHVFCNASQSYLLDKMVTRFWKRPRYYVDDPYSPYHSREEFPTTRRKPVGLLK